ncbi:MAG TPA: chemotaxis protein CheB [Dyella sp.]|nr:chemotaxis protein CheB [Dyella sp.]
MAEGTAVVLLFDDTELGTLLREVLQERGARIVHEGGPGELDRALVERVAADVLVINLGDDVDEVMDRLDAAIEGDHPRVVFNEAESSRALDGWARARWARHLAAKVLASHDVDPPRPADAVEVVDAQSPDPSQAEASDDAGEPAPSPHDAEVAAESESLEAELEALLSGEPLPGDEAGDADAATTSVPDAPSLPASDELDDFELDELLLDSHDHPPLYDGNFTDGATAGPAPDGPSPPLAEPAEDDLIEDVLRLADAEDPTPLAPAPAPPAGGADELFQRTDSWSLVDDEDLAGPPPVPPTPKPSADEFGIEKVSPLEFLAPEPEADLPGIEPTMTLELVSMEEAVAPKPYEPVGGGEMMLEELSGGLSRIVLLGATFASSDSVQAFLSELPAGMRAAIVHVQHQGDRPVDELVRELSPSCALNVREAAAGQAVRAGDLVVVPADHLLRVTRDGRMELKPAPGTPAATPSIDATFSAVANVFGVDALAIVFAGQANDAVAGCQAVHDRGGRIWVEDAAGEHFADMVSGVMAEHLADFSGTPAQLAARLIEEY